MAECLSQTEHEAYGFTYMKSSLLNHFGSDIIITEIKGKRNIVTFKRTCDTILHDFYNAPKDQDPIVEKMRIIKTAAKLIKNDIKFLPPTGNTYPSKSEMSDETKCLQFIPDTLKSLLQDVMTRRDSLKIASVGQAIMQASRPRGILCPLQLGTALQLHHHYKSRFLLDTLCKHGVCSSYQEVKRYERSAALAQGTEIPGYTPGHQ